MRLLQLYADSSAPEKNFPKVRRHLARCVHCRNLLGQIVTGVEASRKLQRVTLPREAEERIRGVLSAAAKRRAGSFPVFYRIRVALVAAAVVVAVAGTLLFFRYYSQRGVVVHSSKGLAGEFERTAIEYHQKHLVDRLRYGYSGTDVREARSWIASHIGLEAELVIHREGEEHRYVFEGVTSAQIGDNKAAVVAYKINRQPVTLLTAKYEGVSGVPPAGLLSKNIYYRLNDNRKLLTWRSGEQIYTLVSELPGFGQQGCLICHNDPDRVARIRRMAASQ